MQLSSASYPAAAGTIEQLLVQYCMLIKPAAHFVNNFHTIFLANIVRSFSCIVLPYIKHTTHEWSCIEMQAVLHSALRPLWRHSPLVGSESLTLRSQFF
jgi:hypothetical protein